MDTWTIAAAVWLPVGGILLALCLYDLTEREATPIQPRTSRGARPAGSEGRTAEEIFPSSTPD